MLPEAKKIMLDGLESIEPFGNKVEIKKEPLQEEEMCKTAPIQIYITLSEKGIQLG